MKTPVNIVWLRRDLRLNDQAALYHSLKTGVNTQLVFIFDKHILDKLSNKADKRVQFIYETLQQIHKQLLAWGSGLQVYYGTPEDAFKLIVTQFNVQAVYTNNDYEAYAIQRDASIKNWLQSQNIPFYSYKDQVIFEKDEVLKDDGKPYTVFTPYSKKWKQKLHAFFLKQYPCHKYYQHFNKDSNYSFPTLQDMQFKPVSCVFPLAEANHEIIQAYHKQRDFPAILGTSRLGVHLRFGTISIRALAQQALTQNETYLNELIWRDFYHAITWHFPHINQGKSFRKEYDNIVWDNNEAHFEAWCNGKTGYPIVDAGMRELNETGYMHNRVRMIVASFLTKHLLIDWRWGEAYFAEKLLDFDFAANNGGWQWASGSGCDAAPYFRVFNPTLQTQKFDPHKKYIRQWVPEFEGFNYTKPIVNHEAARKKALERYAQYLKG